MSDIINVTKGTDLKWYVVMTLGPFADELAAERAADRLRRFLRAAAAKASS